MRETGRQTDVAMTLDNTLIITAYIAYFLAKYFFRAVPRIQFAYEALCLMSYI